MLSENQLSKLGTINNYLNNLQVMQRNSSYYNFDLRMFNELSASLRLSQTELAFLLTRLVRAIALFTGAHVPAVRDSNVYDENLALSLGDAYTTNTEKIHNLASLYIDDIDISDIPTKEDYKESKQILDYLIKNKSHDDSKGIVIKKLYRGLNDISMNLLNAWIRPGAEFDLGDIVSTTIDVDTARKFAYRKKYRVLLYVSNPFQYGAYVNALSAYDSEKEVVLSGVIKTRSCSGNILDLKTTVSEYFPIKKSNNWMEIISYLQKAENIVSGKNKKSVSYAQLKQIKNSLDETFVINTVLQTGMNKWILIHS